VWHCDPVKNTLIAYFGILALAGLVSLSVLGASMLQKGNKLGVPVLVVVAAGLLLTFAYAVVTSRKAESQRPSAPKVPDLNIVTTTSSADFSYTPAVVWSAIRPAETAVEISSETAYAFSVPAIADGPPERQCFFGWNGSINVLEVLEEVPERLAVTQSLLPSSGAPTKTVYRLESTPAGCRLTIETAIELPRDHIPNRALIQSYGDSYLVRVESFLRKGLLQEAGRP